MAANFAKLPGAAAQAVRIKAWPSARDELAYPGTDGVSTSV